jgi:hypothetical protein
MTLTNVPDPAQFCGREFTSLAVVVDVPRYLRSFCMAFLPADDRDPTERVLTPFLLTGTGSQRNYLIYYVF